MSGRSRIAFSMLPEETELPFTIEAILGACLRWPMRLDVNAVPDPPPSQLWEIPNIDQWLGEILSSGNWKNASQALMGELAGVQKKRLAGAARRISSKAMAAIRSGSRRGMGEMLRGAVNDELDVLAGQYGALREPERREVAAAALSLLATEEIAKYRVELSPIVDIGHALPFIPIIFGPHEPAYNVTALELPYRLILSPVPNSRWRHGTKPVEHRGRTELWHTRLTSAELDTGPDRQTNVRALWSPDYPLSDAKLVQYVNQNKPFRMPLDPLDRQMMVKLMSGFGLSATEDRSFTPHTAVSRRLSLSSLGALLDAEGNWDPPRPEGVSLEQWRHLATYGRDHYVRVVYSGMLNLRHAASLVKVTERKFETFETTEGSSARVAVLRQKFFIIVRERVKIYDGVGHACDGRNFPFSKIEILTRVTPSLLAPDQAKRI